MGVYAPDGSLNVILGSPGTGIYSAEGYIRVTDVTGVSDNLGLYAADGSWNVTILVSEAVRVSVYASNGSYNIVDGAGKGIYSPCGAFNVTFQ